MVGEMGKDAFNRIMEGLEDALAYADGDQSRGRETRIELPIPDVAALRAKLGFTQQEFASYCKVSVRTIQNWEQGRRLPEGPARVLLTIIDREPQAVRRALEAA